MSNYNHYTPQSDGSYRRSTVQDSNRRSGPRPPYPGNNPHPPKAPPSEPPACPPPKVSEPSMPPPPKHPETQPREDGILSFLKGLLPRQIDAADLLVISLLLLMGREECGEDSLSPLLTIALYFLL